MSADIIMFRPKPNPNREQAIHNTLIQMADAILSSSKPEFIDTAPCEMIPYHAPENDSA